MVNATIILLLFLTSKKSKSNFQGQVVLIADTIKKIFMMPAISIIVLFYNLEEYVSYCLNSILAQTFRDFELICINDGSTDGTRELLEEYAKKDSRIKLIHQENQGISVARNNGMKLAQGKYIAFIDGDDAITPEYFEVLYREAEKSGADITLCDYIDIAPDLKRVPEPCEEHSGIVIERDVVHVELSEKIGIIPVVWSKLFRRDVLMNVSFVSGIVWEDEIFSSTILFRLKKVCCIKGPMYLYTQRPNSIAHSSFSQLKAKSYLFIYDEIIKLEGQLTSLDDKKRFHRRANGFLRKLFYNLYSLDKSDFKETLPEIQDYFQRWYANKEIRFRDFKLKHRLLMLMLIKRWNCGLLGLYELDMKTGGFVRKFFARKHRH